MGNSDNEWSLVHLLEFIGHPSILKIFQLVEGDNEHDSRASIEVWSSTSGALTESSHSL